MIVASNHSKGQRKMSQRPKILIVDDDASIRHNMVEILKPSQYDIRLFDQGQPLLDELPEASPDLMILDVMLPDMNGFELCRQIKADPRYQHIPIILITAMDGKEVLANGVDAGADDFLHKPVSKLELRARVQSMLRIKRQYDELEGTLKMREELSNMIVHDMSSPIISVLLHATLMDEKVNDPELKKHLDMIKAGADRLDSFVNDLLMAAKMEQSKFLLNYAPTDINQLALDAKKHFSIIAQSKGIQLHFELPEPPLEAIVDSNLLRRVIGNLLANALQYSPSATTVILHLKALRVDERGNHFQLSVMDEGPGIPEEYRERVFEKFEVVDLKRKGVPQIGLGLTFCKMVADAHGGKIFVKANQPQGSCFVVEI
jgi:signal transduction histidine kinase